MYEHTHNNPRLEVLTAVMKKVNDSKKMKTLRSVETSGTSRAMKTSLPRKPASLNTITLQRHTEVYLLSVRLYVSKHSTQKSRLRILYFEVREFLGHDRSQCCAIFSDMTVQKKNIKALCNMVLESVRAARIRQHRTVQYIHPFNPCL